MASGVHCRHLLLRTAPTVCSLLSGYWIVVLAQYLTWAFPCPCFCCWGGRAVCRHTADSTHIWEGSFTCVSSGILWSCHFQHVIAECKVGHFISYLLFWVLQLLWSLNSFWILDRFGDLCLGVQQAPKASVVILGQGLKRALGTSFFIAFVCLGYPLN